MMQRPQLLSFPQDGRAWRIDWLGPLLTIPARKTPMVQLQISAESVSAPREKRIIEVSVALLALLVVGTEWVDGIRLGTSSETRTTSIEVDVQAKALQFAKAWGRMQATYVVPPAALSIARQINDTQVVVVRRALRDGIGDLVIPCTELFRAYFGRFSCVSYQILTGCLIDRGPGRLFDGRRCFWQDGAAYLVLGMHIKNTAAQDVARIAFEPIASETAQRIVSDMIAVSNGSGRYCLAMSPPFSGKSMWRVRGQSIGTAAWPRFLVHQLLGCTAMLPFHELHSYRDNPGGERTDEDAAKTAFANVVKQWRAAKDGLVTISDRFDPTSHEIPMSLFDDDIESIAPPLPHLTYRNPNPKRRSGSIITELPTTGKLFSSGVGVGTSSLTPVTIEPTDVRGELESGTLAFFEHTVEAMQRPLLATDLNVTIKTVHTTVPVEWKKRAASQSGHRYGNNLGPELAESSSPSSKSTTSLSLSSNLNGVWPR